jgi:hypothetical protein
VLAVSTVVASGDLAARSVPCLCGFFEKAFGLVAARVAARAGVAKE